MKIKNSSRVQYLAKNTAIFGLGNIATKIITFLLVPLYTHVLTTAEYGVVDLINTICTVLTPFIILNVGEAVMRFSLDKDADYDRIMSVGLVAFVISIVLGLVMFPLAGIFPIISNYTIIAYFFLVSSSTSHLFFCYLRGKEKLIFYSLGNVIHIFIIAILNIIFLTYYKLGISGYFMAFIISDCIMIIYGFIAGNVFSVLKHFKVDPNLARNMLKYSLVLIPNTFIWWIINSSDHIMVTSLMGVEANGIYAISYKLPTIITSLTSIFNQAWNYSAIKEQGSHDEREYNNIVFKHLVSFIVLVCLFILLIQKTFLKYYVGPEYYEAWKYSPFLIVGSAYLTLATFISSAYTTHKDSFGFLWSGSIGAVTNIVLNIILIPIIGIYGAAIATCISYIAVFAFRVFHTKKYIYFNVNNKEFYIGTVLLLLSCAFIYIDNIYGIVGQLALLIIAIAFYSKTWLRLLKR